MFPRADKVFESWTIGPDPASHLSHIRCESYGRAASPFNIHSGQIDQRRVIDFHGSKVLPKIGRA